MRLISSVAYCFMLTEIFDRLCGGSLDGCCSFAVSLVVCCFCCVSVVYVGRLLEAKAVPYGENICLQSLVFSFDN